ncbi:tetratricopeptide repeat protein 4-like [Porites lutea]|uniref:tetratricopeptide repeat protein 4-like n=1 Tax=Porites lutea TaxID=51062 RepID=UPI003CC552C9
MAASSVENDVTSPNKGILDFDKETILAIAEVYFQEGNKEYRKGELRNAIYFYTEGINVSCEDDELNAKLYSNRAAAHFCLGNNQETLNDAKAAINLEPTFIKPIVKGASACVKLHLYEEAINWCVKGLEVSFFVTF